jgi:hypothetical protein
LISAKGILGSLAGETVFGESRKVAVFVGGHDDGLCNTAAPAEIAGNAPCAAFEEVGAAVTRQGHTKSLERGLLTTACTANFAEGRLSQGSVSRERLVNDGLTTKGGHSEPCICHILGVESGHEVGHAAGDLGDVGTHGTTRIDEEQKVG